MRRLLVTSISVWLMCLATVAEARDLWWAQLVRALDGNIIEVKPYGLENTVTLKLFGIYAPDLEQSLGANAKNFIEENASGKELAVDVRNTSDDFGRTPAVVYIFHPNQEIENLNEKLLNAGLAQWDAEVAPVNDLFSDAQTHAQQLKVGIWGLAEAPRMGEDVRRAAAPSVDERSEMEASEEQPSIEWYVIRDVDGDYKVVERNRMPEVISGPFKSRAEAEYQTSPPVREAPEMRADAPLPQ
jgi:endonuclease YncB( thermonuclease family)